MTLPEKQYSGFKLDKIEDANKDATKWQYPLLVLLGFGVIDVLFKMIVSTTEIPFTTVENIKSDIKIMRTSTGISVVLDGNMNSIELYNMKGVLMERTQASGSYTRDLESGAYILRINGVGHKFVR